MAYLHRIKKSLKQFNHKFTNNFKNYFNNLYISNYFTLNNLLKLTVSSICVFSLFFLKKYLSFTKEDILNYMPQYELLHKNKFNKKFKI